MAEDRYVRTQHIRDAVRGRETEVLKALGVARKDGASHSRCPYLNHDDANPSWRWDHAKARAFCSCIEGSHTILDVVAHCEGVDFEIAKVRAAEILGRQDLIKEKGSRHHQGIFEEVRANAFMGTFLAPIHRVYARLCHHCGRLGLSPSDLQCFDPAMLSKRFECIAAAAAVSQDHLRIIDRRLRAVDELLTRLARDFGVTKQFIEVRLLRYGFLGQARAVA